VTYKVLKSKQVLPNRKNLMKERDAVTRFQNKEVRNPDVLLGPLRPSGSFSLKRSRPVAGFRVPTKQDWFSKPRSKIEPICIAPCFLTKRERVKISGGPSRKLRKTFEKGEFIIYPNRYCVANFQRRMHALTEVTDTLRMIDPLSYEPWVTHVIRKIVNMLPEILWNANDGPDSPSRKIQARLQYFLRKHCRTDRSPMVKE